MMSPVMSIASSLDADLLEVSFVLCESWYETLCKRGTIYQNTKRRKPNTIADEAEITMRSRRETKAAYNWAYMDLVHTLNPSNE